MLFFLFPEDELKRIFERLGYDYAPEMVRENVEYYDHRTSHGSTLSFIAHAGILADLDPESSWERYMVALESDVGDVQGGTTQEGIHMGVMAGTLDLIQRGYLGTDIRDGVLQFDPKPVGNLDGLSFPMQFRGTPLEVELDDGRLTVAAQSDDIGQPIQVRVGDETREIKPAKATPSAPDNSSGDGGKFVVERIVIFGATGDLTGRYLIPALAKLYEAGRLPSGIKITGIDRRRWKNGKNGFRRLVLGQPGAPRRRRIRERPREDGRRGPGIPPGRRDGRWERDLGPGAADGADHRLPGTAARGLRPDARGPEEGQPARG